MGSNTAKKPWTNLHNSYKNWSKEIKSDNFCYRKVGRAITKWGAIEKSPLPKLEIVKRKRWKAKLPGWGIFSLGIKSLTGRLVSNILAKVHGFPEIRSPFYATSSIISSLRGITIGVRNDSQKKSINDFIKSNSLSLIKKENVLTKNRKGKPLLISLTLWCFAIHIKGYPILSSN